MIFSKLKLRYFTASFPRLFCLIGCLGIISLEQKGFATPYTWNGSSGGSWQTSTNWSPSGIPSSSDTASIESGSASYSVLLGANQSISFLILTPVATGDSISLGGDGTPSLYSLTFDNSPVLVANSAKINCPVILNGNLSVLPDGIIEFLEPISGSFSLTLDWNLLRIKAPCTYTGGTTIGLASLALIEEGSLYSSGEVSFFEGSFLDISQTSGSITIGALTDAPSSVSPYGAVTLGSQTLNFGYSNSGTFTFSGTFGGTSSSGVISGTANYVGTGTATFAGDNSLNSFNTQVSSGTLALGTGGLISQAGSLTLSGGTFNISGVTPSNVTIGDLIGTSASAGAITLGSKTLTFGTSNNTTFNGIIAGAGNIIKNGSGSVTLGGTNTFTGSTTINVGSIITAPTNLAGSVSIASGAFLNFNQAGTFSQSIAGSGTLVFSGTGTLGLGNNSSLTGEIKINGGGTLSVANINNLGSASIKFSSLSGIFQDAISGATTISNPFIFSNSGAIDTQGNSLQITGPVTGSGGLSLTNSGAGSGSVTLTNYSSYSGNISVQNGTLFLDGSTAALQGSLALASNTNVTFQGNATGTYANTITGSGSVTVNVTGTVTFTGANSYSGLTTVQSGSLEVNSIAIVNNVVINSGSNFIINESRNQTYQDQFSGNGTIKLIGTGSLVFSNNSSFAGTIQVASPSSLEIDADYNASTVDVLQGATFSGNGTINTLTNAGILIPGDPGVGTLTVVDIVTMSPTSEFQAYVSPLTSNLLIAQGQAAIDGACVVIPQESGFYGIGKQYVIIESAVVNGTFASVSSIDSFFLPTIVYTPTQVILNIQNLNPFYHFPFGNYNEQMTGENINDLVENHLVSPDMAVVIDSLEGLSVSQINNALDQMHPAAFSAIAELQAELGAQMLNLFSRKPELSCSCFGDGRLWVQPFGNWLKEKHHGMQIGFHATTTGIAVGYDYQLLNCWTLGLGGAYSNTNLRWNQHRGYNYIETAVGSLYSDWWFGNFYMGMSTYLGKDFYKLHRHIQFSTTNRQANSKSHAVDLAGQFKALYVFGTKSFFLYPYALVDYLYLKNSGFTETGADSLNLHVKHYKSQNLRAEGGIGLRFIDRNISQTFCISPMFCMGYVLEHPLQRTKFVSTFQGQNISFKTRGWNHSWQLLNLQMGITFSYRCFSLDAEYLADISPEGTDDYFNQRANFNFRYSF